MVTEQEREAWVDPQALAELVAGLRGALAPTRVQKTAALAPYTTWRVGGPADLLITAESVDEVVLAAGSAATLGVPWRVLGYGSNVLIRDGGIAGLVIVNRSRELTIEGTLVTADGGMLLSRLANRTAAAGLAGLEWCAGIPGSVGGAVVSNAGAHGGQLSDTLRRVLLLQPAGTRSATLTEEQHGAAVSAVWHQAEALDLAYRHSRLRARETPEEIVLRVECALRADEPGAIKEQMAAQRRQRKATQPLERASAGSVFKNPSGGSAARLIDEAGLKGMRIGGAQVSIKHANFMVTDSTATAADLLALVATVRQRIQERYGISLELEVQPIGRQTHPQG